MSSFERLLARVLRQPLPPATACPTAETLAAYLENGLTRSEQASVERHASTCARCAAHLAALVQLADRLDGATAPAPAWWRRHPWLVPAAALALTVVVWTSLPRERVAELTRPAPASVAAPAPTADTANRDGAPPPVPASKTPALEVAEKRPAPAPAAPSPHRAASELPGTPRDGRAAFADKDARVELQSYAAPSSRSSAESDRDTVDRLSRVDAPPPSANEVLLPPRELAQAAPERQSPPPAPAPMAPADLKKEQPSAAKTLERAAPSPAPVASPSPASSADAGAPTLAAGAHAESRLKAAARPFVVVAPDARISWRVVAGRIERSTDAGGTWAAEHAPAISVPLAGSAPATDACWIVDVQGVIVRRDTSGEWHTVTPPTPSARLTGIEARSATAATLLTADGHRYGTEDGGATWERR